MKPCTLMYFVPSSLCPSTVEEGPKYTLPNHLDVICDKVLQAACLLIGKPAADSSFSEASVLHSGITRM